LALYHHRAKCKKWIFNIKYKTTLLASTGRKAVVTAAPGITPRKGSTLFMSDNFPHSEPLPWMNNPLPWVNHPRRELKDQHHKMKFMKDYNP